MARLKNTIVSVIAAGCFLFPSIAFPSSKKSIDYDYLDQNKKVIERVNYDTFKSNLESGISKQKIESQEKFLEDFIEAVNSHPGLRPERGYNISRGVSEEEFSNFIFDEVLKGKLNYEIKTATDIIVGINMVLEHLARYNHKMDIVQHGLGSDVNNDGRFDGVKWVSLMKLDEKLQKEIIKDPRKSEKIELEECKHIDGTPTDLLLMGRKIIEYTNEGLDEPRTTRFEVKESEMRGKKDAVEIVCRNYMSALEIMFKTAKKKYPELIENVQLLQMPMPGHIFGAFINKKTLEYIVVDPTWHDVKEDFDIKTFVWPKDEKIHYDCLQQDNFFKSLPIEKGMYDYWGKYSRELIFHSSSKKMLEKLIPEIQKVAKKYPDSPEIARIEISAYLNLSNHKEFSKAFQLLKSVYDDKDRKETIPPDSYSILLLGLGGLAYELKDYKTSLEYYNKCASFYVAESRFADEAMLGLAESHLELGKTDKPHYYQALFRAKDVLDLLPRYQKEAKKIVSKAAKELWEEENATLNDYMKNREKRSAFNDYLKGRYEKAVQKLEKRDDMESKLLLAESYASLNNYDKAKSVYESVIKGDDKNLASLAEFELKCMNRKFFLYGYMHFFDYKLEESLKEFEFIKSKITPKDEIAERTSLFLIYNHLYMQNPVKLFKEADYFLRTFQKSEYKDHVKEIVEEVKKAAQSSSIL